MNNIDNEIFNFEDFEMNLQKEFEKLDDMNHNENNKWGIKNDDYEKTIDLKQELKNLNMVK